MSSGHFWQEMPRIEYLLDGEVARSNELDDETFKEYVNLISCQGYRDDSDRIVVHVDDILGVQEFLGSQFADMIGSYLDGNCDNFNGRIFLQEVGAMEEIGQLELLTRIVQSAEGTDAIRLIQS